jgi:GST-like protein
LRPLVRPASVPSEEDASMIDLYYWPTPNGWKITIFLEETGIPHRIVPVNIGAGEQFAPDFLAISPNNRMPAIVDSDGPDGQPISLFESGAILVYLGEKTGRFLPSAPRARYEVLQWLMFQMGGVGPMFGQASHFRRYAPEPLPYAIERYTNESKRLCRVLDQRLADREFVAGDYSIADMAIFPWVHAAEQSVGLDTFAYLARWVATLRARPAVARGLAVMSDVRRPAQMSEEARSILFGTRQMAGR